MATTKRLVTAAMCLLVLIQAQRGLCFFENLMRQVARQRMELILQQYPDLLQEINNKNNNNNPQQFGGAPGQRNPLPVNNGGLGLQPPGFSQQYGTNNANGVVVPHINGLGQQGGGAVNPFNNGVFAWNTNANKQQGQAESGPQANRRDNQAPAGAR